MNKRRKNISAATLENPPKLPAAVATRRTEAHDIEDAAARDVEIRIHEIMESEVGRGGYVRIYRRMPREANFNQLTKAIALDQFSTDWVFETYGGGEYQVKAYGEKHRLIKQMNWTVDPSIPSKSPDSPAPAASGSTDVAAIIRAAKEGREDDRSSGQDLTPLIAVLLKANSDMMSSMAARNNNGGDNKFMELLLTKALADKPASSLDEVMRLHQMLEKAKKGEDLEEKPEKSMIESIIERVLEGIQPILMAKFGGGNGAAAPVQLQSAPGKITVPSMRTVQPASSETEMDPAVSQFRSAILQAANQKKDPFQWSESMLGFIPQSYHPKIYGAANSDEWFENMFGKTPGADVTKHIEYLSEVRNSILTIAFANSALASVEAKKDPAGFASEFKAWACPSYNEELGMMVTEDDFFNELFSLKYEENKEWMDKLKTALTPAGEAAKN